MNETYPVRAGVNPPNEFTAEYRGKIRRFLFEDFGLQPDGSYAVEWRLKHPLPDGDHKTVNITRVPDSADDVMSYCEESDLAAMRKFGMRQIKF